MTDHDLRVDTADGTGTVAVSITALDYDADTEALSDAIRDAIDDVAPGEVDEV